MSHICLLSMAGLKHLILNHLMQIILICQRVCGLSCVVLMLSFVFEILSAFVKTDTDALLSGFYSLVLIVIFLSH